MTTTFDSWRRRFRTVLATLVVAVLATTICQQCLNSAMAQPGPDPDPGNCQGADPQT